MTYVSIVSIVIIIAEALFVFSFSHYSINRKVVISKNNILWFLPVFVFLFTMYLTGYINNADTFGVTGIVDSIVHSLKSFAFEVNTKYNSALLGTHVLYSLAFFIAYFLAVFTVLSSALALIKGHVLNLIRVSIKKRSETDIVIGYNNSSLSYAKLNPGKCIMWIDHPISNDVKRVIQEEKIPYILSSLTDKSVKRLHKNVRYNFISFEGQESQYQSLMDLFIKVKDEDTMNERNIFLYLEVKYQEMEAIRDQYLKYHEKNPSLFIKTFSRYELISRKFVTEYTIPKYLSPDDFNENRSVKNDKVINVFFFGFGKVNAQLLSMFCQNNQLVTTVDGKLKAKMVNYYVIDKNCDAVNDKRIDNLFSNFNKTPSDLPLPEPLCNYDKIIGDLNSNKTIEMVKEIVNKDKGLNMFIVSFGDDFENVEMASWIKTQFRNHNPVIACRVKNFRVVDKSFICFGNEKEIFTHDYIVDEELQQIAKDISYEYARLSTKSVVEKEQVWASLNHIDLFSNYYAAMNIRFKLNMLGYDLTKDNNAVSVSKEEFMELYNKGTPTTHKYEDYFIPTVRNVIAYCEKLRWNAFYLFNGYQPMLIKDIEIKFDKKYVRKDRFRKIHACLTSHQGLDVLHKKVLEMMKEREIEATIDDVETYAYDYMAFDNPNENLFDTLNRQGYKIVKLKEYKLD